MGCLALIGAQHQSSSSLPTPPIALPSRISLPLSTSCSAARPSLLTQNPLSCLRAPHLEGLPTVCQSEGPREAPVRALRVGPSLPAQPLSSLSWSLRCGRLRAYPSPRTPSTLRISAFILCRTRSPDHLCGSSASSSSSASHLALQKVFLTFRRKIHPPSSDT